MRIQYTAVLSSSAKWLLPLRFFVIAILCVDVFTLQYTGHSHWYDSCATIHAFFGVYAVVFTQDMFLTATFYTTCLLWGVRTALLQNSGFRWILSMTRIWDDVTSLVHSISIYRSAPSMLMAFTAKAYIIKEGATPELKDYRVTSGRGRR